MLTRYKCYLHAVTYKNSCIDCWAKSGQGTFAARKAEQLLERMEIMYKAGNEAKPTTHSNNSVLQAISGVLIRRP